MDKILNFLGIARRAGKLSLGFDAAEESVNKKKSKLLILACDVSERTRKSVGIISVNDEGFAKRLEELFA